MPANKNAIIRYMILDEFLSDRNHYYTREMLTEKVNQHLKTTTHGYTNSDYSKDSPTVTKRTIEMDLKAMEDIWGIDYEEESHSLNNKGVNNTAQMKRTIRYADPTFSIFRKPLSIEEKQLLNEVLSTLGQFSGLENFNWLSDLKERLGKADYFRESDGLSERKIIDFSSNEYLKGRDSLGWFFSAISNKKVVKLVYQKFQSLTSQEIIVYPYMLKQYRDRWYLLATPTLDKKLEFNPNFIANFPLDRIVSYEYYEDIPYVDSPVDINDLYDEIIGVTYYWDKEVENIVFAVKNVTVPYIESKPLHGSQTAYKEDEQSRLHEKYHGFDEYKFYHMELKQNYELESLLKSFGRDIVVLSPDSLRNKMLQDIKDQLAMYSIY